MRSVLDLVDRDGCIDIEMLRRCSRTRKLTRERHRVTGSVRGSQQFLRTRLPVNLLDPGRQRERERVERTRRTAERAAAAGDIAFPGGAGLTLNSRHEDKAMRRCRICVAVTALSDPAERLWSNSHAFVTTRVRPWKLEPVSSGQLAPHRLGG